MEVCDVAQEGRLGTCGRSDTMMEVCDVNQEGFRHAKREMSRIVVVESLVDGVDRISYSNSAPPTFTYNHLWDLGGWGCGGRPTPTLDGGGWGGVRPLLWMGREYVIRINRPPPTHRPTTFTYNHL
jgi:hypothetical protein